MCRPAALPARALRAVPCGAGNVEGRPVQRVGRALVGGVLDVVEDHGVGLQRLRRGGRRSAECSNGTRRPATCFRRGRRSCIGTSPPSAHAGELTESTRRGAGPRPPAGAAPPCGAGACAKAIAHDATITAPHSIPRWIDLIGLLLSASGSSPSLGPDSGTGKTPEIGHVLVRADRLPGPGTFRTGWSIR